MLQDYSTAFVVVALISLAASPACARLPRNAGDELSDANHRADGGAAVKTKTADAGAWFRRSGGSLWVLDNIPQHGFNRDRIIRRASVERR